MHTFSLVDEPWIPVRKLDGERVKVSLRDALLEAGNIREIEDPSPLTVAALHRFLLSVLHRALEGPRVSRDIIPWMENGFPPERINTYLGRWRERFDLFHSTEPFLQVGDLVQETKQKPKPWTVLLPERDEGNNTDTLFNDAKLDGYRPAAARPDEAARAILTRQTFALQGLIQGFITSAPASPTATDLIVLVVGDDLRQTLCLNLVRYVNSKYDIPYWERNGLSTASYMKRNPTEQANGHVQIYAWPSRSILLLPEQCGEEVVVHEAIVDSGIRFERSSASERDPMGVYRYPREGSGRTDLYAMKFNPERAFWRDFTALLPQKSGTKKGGIEPQVVEHALNVCEELGRCVKPPRALVVGLANDQKKILMWRAERFDLPPAILSDKDVHHSVSRALQTAETTGTVLRLASETLAAALLSQNKQPQVKKGDITKLAKNFPGDAIYWTTLETAFPTFLAQLTPDYDQDDVLTGWDRTLLQALQQAWNETVQHVGRSTAALRAVAKAEKGVLDKTFNELRKRTAATETDSEER